MVADAAGRFGAAFRGRAGGAWRPAPTSRPGPARARHAVAAGPGVLHRPHRRRPGRDRAAQPAARAPASTAWPASGADARHPLLAPAPGRDRGAVRGPGPRRRSTTRPTHDPRFRRNRVRHEVLPLLDDVAGRDVVAVLARQARRSRDDAELLDELAGAARPDRRRAPWPRAPASRWPAWPCAGGCAAPAEGHPPDAATVERVLAVARLERRGHRGRPAAGGSRGRAAGSASSRPRDRDDARSCAGRRMLGSGAGMDQLGRRPRRRRCPTSGRVDRGGRRAPGADRRAGRGDHRRLRRPAAAARRGAQGRVHVHERPGPAPSTCPVEFDFMAVSSYGSATRPAAWCASSRTSTSTSPTATC